MINKTGYDMRNLLLYIFGIVLFLFCHVAYSEETKNLAYMKKYTFEPTAQYEHTRDQGDATQLTDGQYTAGYFWTSRNTVGWQESGPIRIEIDLEAVYSLDTICINTARGNHAEVSFPEGVDIFVSADKKRYAYLGDLLQGQMHADGPYLVKKFCSSNLNTFGRYVLLMIQPKGKYTFLDEIEVFGNGEQIKTTVYNNGTVMKREEINDFLKLKNELRHKKEALVKLGERLLSNLKGINKVNIQQRINLLVAKLEKLCDANELEKIQDDLFLLHREIITDCFKEPLIIWHKNPWSVFTPIDTPKPELFIKNDLHLDLMMRGSASSAVILTNNTDKPQVIKISTRLEGIAPVIPNLTVREVIPVITSNHDVVGDALRDVENGAVSIKPGESKQIWLTVLADAAPAGNYTGWITLTLLNSNNTMRNISVCIKIWPAMFPEKQHINVNAWSYLNWRPIEKFPKQAMADLFSHHVNVFELHTSELPWPHFKSSNDKSLADYSKFDKVIRHHKGAKMFLFFMFFNHERWRTFGGKFEFMSNQWKAVFQQWLKEWVSHMKEQGLSYENFAFYPVDEPENSDEAGYLFDTAQIIKEIDPKLQVYTTIGTLANLDLLRLTKMVDIFQVHAKELSSSKITKLKSMKKEIWSYTANGGGKQADPMSFYRAQAWRAFQQGATGIGFWAYADTGPFSTAWDDFDGKRPDFSVIYEGKNKPISSKRWEAWREGVEDYELLCLVREKLKSDKELAEFECQVNKAIDNMSDYQQFEAIRRYLLSIASRP